MDDPDGQLRWHVDAGPLGRRETRALQEAVDAVAYWLQKWPPVAAVEAAVPSVRVAVPQIAVDAADGGVVTAEYDNQGIRITVPRQLANAGPSMLRMRLLDGALAALEHVAGQLPQQGSRLVPGITEIEVSDANSLGVALEFLEPVEMMLLGRLDSATSDQLSRFHELTHYITERIEEPGLAGMADIEGGCSEAVYIIELTGDEPG